MINERLLKIQNKNCFSNILTDEFIETKCDYIQLKPIENNAFRLISNIFKSKTDIEYCLDINYAHLDYDAKFYYNLYISDIFLDEFKNKKSGILVYDINFNPYDYITNSNNEIKNVGDCEKSEIMGNVSYIINEYIKQFPKRKIFGIDLKNHPDMVDIYSNSFRKIFPNNFYKFNINSTILFIDESILKESFKIEY